MSCFLFSAVTDVLSAATITYTYDNLSRLTKVDYGNGGTITYAYDAAGNRLSLVSTPSDLTPPATPLITDDGLYTTNLTQLYAVWVSNDPESGMELGHGVMQGAVMVLWPFRLPEIMMGMA